MRTPLFVPAVLDEDERVSVVPHRGGPVGASALVSSVALATTPSLAGNAVYLAVQARLPPTAG